MRQVKKEKGPFQQPSGPFTHQELLNYMAADPEVVNTTDQVPESFDSIAATFGFQHHIGTDAALELKVIKCILRRETLLSRVRTMVAKLIKDMEVAASSGAPPNHRQSVLKEHAGLLDYLTLVREATADTIEAVVLWREGVPMYPPPAFMWEKKNYLLKMHKDLDFLADAEPLVAALNISQDKLRSNPLMLSETLKRQQQEWESGVPTGAGDDLGSDQSSEDRSDAERARLSTLGKVLVLESKFEAERQQARAVKAQFSLAEQHQLGGIEASMAGPSRSAPDPNLWRKKVNVFNWFDEAQGQLKSLRKSMEHGQVVLKALGDRAHTAKVLSHLPYGSADAAITARMLQQQYPQTQPDRLVPMASKAPNPAVTSIAKAIDVAPDGHAYRHPLEVEDLQWEGGSSPAYPVPFTRELNQALIRKADRRKKLPPRSFLPKALAHVRSRYREPARRPMTPAEYERSVGSSSSNSRASPPPPSGPGVRKLLDRKRGTSEGKRGGGNKKQSNQRNVSWQQDEEEEEEGRQQAYSVASMRDPLGQSAGEGELEAARLKAKGRGKKPASAPGDMSAQASKSAPRKVTSRFLASLLTEEDLTILGMLREPPKSLAVAGAAVLILLAPGNEVPGNVTWPAFQSRIAAHESFLQDLAGFDSHHVPHFKTRALRNFITCGPDMLPAALLEKGLSPAKISAWVFQVLLQQPEFVKHAGNNANVRAVRASIRQVVDLAAPRPPPPPPQTVPQEALPPPSWVGASSRLLYNGAHQLKDRAVFISITESGGDVHQHQLKVYDPATSQELRADLTPLIASSSSSPLPLGAPAAELSTWVNTHLERMVKWEDGQIRLIQ